MEQDTKVVKDIKSSKGLSLVQTPKEFNETANPVALISLQEAKMRSTKHKKGVQEIRKSVKKSSGMRHSFYPYWTRELSETKEFASRNGFREVPLESTDYYSTVSFFWHNRELAMTCDQLGRINEIKHRNTRWLSATIKRYERDDGEDIRAYLETRSLLDDDECCLKALIQLLDGRSIFQEAFAQQLKENSQHDELSQKPLIPELFHLSFHYRSMRIIKPVFKFENAYGDVLLLHDISDGIFSASHIFEWFPRHYEAEIRINMKGRSDEELCKRSFEMSLMLFDFVKKS